jgi:predicted GNAT family acetyltransferase
MPTFELQGLDGKTYEVEAPSADAAVGAFKQFSAPQAPAAPAVDTMTDVAKSAGIGLAQGAIGIGTLPGNIEQLGRLGINKGAELMGYEAPVSQNTFLPNYGDVKGEIEKHTGEFYKPQTTAGEYARTIGEFAPMAATGGAGIAGRVANVVAPALMSETAGQLTEGSPMEPYARVAGAFAGGSIPRAITPLPADAARAGHLATLEKEGVTALTAGQKTGSSALRWTEAVTKDTPGGGGKAAAMEATAAEQFTRAALKRAGVDANRAKPEVINQAFNDLGRKFDHLAGSTVLNADPTLTRKLLAARSEYNQLVPESMRRSVVSDTVDDVLNMAQQHGHKIPGEVYQAVRSRLERMRSTASRDPEFANTLRTMREALDDAMEKSMPAPRAGQWREVRSQYKNLLTIERALSGAGDDAINGLVSPAALRTAAKIHGKRAYSRGKDDLGELARAGKAVMQPLPQSGTAPREAARLLLGGGAMAATGGNVFAGIGAALAEPAVRALASRVLMSKPVQNYMANQRAAGYLRERPGMANALVAPEILAEHGGLVGRQTTGAYPPGDPRWKDDSKR